MKHHYLKEIGALYWSPGPVRRYDSGAVRPGVTYRCEGVVTNGEISASKLGCQDKIMITGWAAQNQGERYIGRVSETYNESIKNLSFADVIF